VSIKILKADGTYEFFKVEKLRRSLRRSGASPAEVSHIIDKVHLRLFDGIRTQQIYRYAFELLRESEIVAANRYSLRRALFGLGPTGFPFEKFIARMYERGGYTSITNISLDGACALHEIDVACYNDSHSFVAEVKFHSRPGMKTDLQVALYSHARLLDLKSRKICSSDVCGIEEFRLITNTKFTSSAEKYAECVGLPLLSWDYPKKNNLHDHIQRAGIYPITVLGILTAKQIATLFFHDIITCRDLIEKSHLLKYLHISKIKEEQIISEAKAAIQTT
jgi:hypothetical protein